MCFLLAEVLSPQIYIRLELVFLVKGVLRLLVLVCHFVFDRHVVFNLLWCEGQANLLLNFDCRGSGLWHLLNFKLGLFLLLNLHLISGCVNIWLFWLFALGRFRLRLGLFCRLLLGGRLGLFLFLWLLLLGLLSIGLSLRLLFSVLSLRLGSLRSLYWLLWLRLLYFNLLLLNVVLDQGRIVEVHHTILVQPDSDLVLELLLLGLDSGNNVLCKKRIEALWSWVIEQLDVDLVALIESQGLQVGNGASLLKEFGGFDLGRSLLLLWVPRLFDFDALHRGLDELPGNLDRVHIILL